MENFSFTAETEDQPPKRKTTRRGFRANPTERRVFGGLLDSESRRPAPQRPEYRVPFPVIAPEVSVTPTPLREIAPREAWLGSAVPPLEQRQVPPPSELELDPSNEDEDEDEEEEKEKKAVAKAKVAAGLANKTEALPSQVAPEIETIPPSERVGGENETFEDLVKRAGLNSLFRSLDEQPAGESLETAPTAELYTHEEQPHIENQADQEPPEPPTDGFRLAQSPSPDHHIAPPAAVAAPALKIEQSAPDSREYIKRSQARVRALVAFAAGLMIGSHSGKKKVRRELTRTLEEVEEKLRVADQKQEKMATEQKQAEQQTYNQEYWDHHVARPEQPATVITPTQRFEQPLPAAAALTPERPPATVVQPEEVTAESAAEDPFHLQPEKHVERDAWHSIVIDKYGHEDISARGQYGQAFEQERREVKQEPPADDGQQSAGGTSAGTVPTPTVPMAPEPTLPAGLTSPGLPSGPPVTRDPQHLLPATAKNGVSMLLSPWVWLLVGILLLIFFGASLIG